MAETLSKTYALLVDVILPHLREVQANQAEQRLQTESLNHNLEKFRSEMEIHFAEIRAEIAACRQELEDAMVTIRERETLEDPESAGVSKKRLIH